MSLFHKIMLSAKKQKSLDQLSEQEIEDKFASLYLAFKTDRLTLDKRIDRHQRSRDIIEHNIDNEMQALKETLQSLGHICTDAQTRDVYIKIQHHIEVLETTTSRVSSRAEVYGAVQQELRISKAVDVMVQHVENLKRMYEKDHQELEETKKLLQENRVLGDHGGRSMSSLSVGGATSKSLKGFAQRLTIGRMMNWGGAKKTVRSVRTVAVNDKSLRQLQPKSDAATSAILGVFPLMLRMMKWSRGWKERAIESKPEEGKDEVAKGEEKDEEKEADKSDDQSNKNEKGEEEIEEIEEKGEMEEAKEEGSAGKAALNSTEPITVEGKSRCVTTKNTCDIRIQRYRYTNSSIFTQCSISVFPFGMTCPPFTAVLLLLVPYLCTLIVLSQRSSIVEDNCSGDIASLVHHQPRLAAGRRRASLAVVSGGNRVQTVLQTSSTSSSSLDLDARTRFQSLVQSAGSLIRRSSLAVSSSVSSNQPKKPFSPQRSPLLASFPSNSSTSSVQEEEEEEEQNDSSEGRPRLLSLSVVERLRKTYEETIANPEPPSDSEKEDDTPPPSARPLPTEDTKEEEHPEFPCPPPKEEPGITWNEAKEDTHMKGIEEVEEKQKVEQEPDGEKPKDVEPVIRKRRKKISSTITQQEKIDDQDDTDHVNR
ncbi:hypothetical protein CAPTEDRAFT_225487 [Capitella teleta]|uniref:Uncharacterized protein n=1 Tax=Capitella teleta TaxID=283909 RepID=R7T996_CAPTE|nr:hypothetical protein CAPTEDRAFT_225487 [Capitella teleta]|eukprot:ELT90013.1 hypothetical protein CAPTEDRAFT_225487 [Capitella teleta]